MKYNFDLELVNNNSLLLILQQIKKNSTILEFGPANGRLTKYLKQELNCDVYLAEIEEAAGKEALQYGKELVVGDVENFEWFDKFHEIRFDYILFADVLEHLRDPKEVLAKSKLLLKQEGSIILSVPNMCHNSVLINLMNNNLTYTNVGLLDNTHIHFFSHFSLEQMIKDCDLYPCKRMGTYCEVSKNEIPNSIYDVKGISPEYWNTRKFGEVYQFVYELKKGKEYVENEINLLKPYYNHYWTQIYIDEGTGLSEEASDKYFMDINSKHQRFEFRIENQCRTIKIDPVNTCGVIKVNCISVCHDGVEEPLTEFVTNAEYVFDNVYYFKNSDPSFIINGEKFNKYKEVKIIVDYDIVTVDSLAISNMEETIVKLNEKNSEKTNEIMQLNNENKNLKDEIDKLNKIIAELKASQGRFKAKKK